VDPRGVVSCLCTLVQWLHQGCQIAHSLIARDGKAAAVDPVEPSKMLDAASKEGATITCALTTHKHACV